MAKQPKPTAADEPIIVPDDSAAPGQALVPAGEPSDPLEVGAVALTGESIARGILTDAAGALQIVGRIQAFDFLRRVADSAIAQAYVSLKESKQYKGLPYKDENGKPATVATLQQFCVVYLGRSYRRCEELAANMHTLGADLYETAEEVGFRSRDYAALRALPANDQAAVADALGSDDKERAIQVLADLVSRQAAEKAAALAAKEAAEAQAAEAKADYAAVSQVVGEKTAELTRLRSERIRKPLPLSEEMAVWAGAVAHHHTTIRQSLALIDQMRADAMQIDIPAPDTPERDAHLRGLAVLAGEMDRLEGLSNELGGVLHAYNTTLRPVAYSYEEGAE